MKSIDESRFLFLIPLLLLASCDGTGGKLKVEPVTNAHGQTITYVDNTAFHGWLKEHRKVKIISIAQITAGEGERYGFIVVYENKDPNVE